MPRRIHVGVRAKPETGPRLQEFTVEGAKASSSRDLVRLEIGVGGVRSEFHFDDFFDESSSQASVFDACARPLIDEVLQGYNGTLFAYGQTGAGKTYTVSGPLGTGAAVIGLTEDRRGICDRTIMYMFQAVAAASDEIIAIKMSVIEIYNDLVHDLLRPMGSAVATKPDYGIVPLAPHKFTIIDTPSGVVVPDLCILSLASAEEGLVKVSEALGNRSIAEHQLNRQSSRSHCIFTFYVTRTRAASSGGETAKSGAEAVQSKLHLVDLAGSERIEKSGSTGGLAKEATYINRSLTFLEQVVIALTQSGREHIPYRQSKLTYLLKDSLGGNCNTYLVACIWMHADQAWETLSTLRFASRMSRIENNPIRNNLVPKDSGGSVRPLMNQIDALKKELAMRDVLSRGDEEPWLADLSEAQSRLAARTACKLLKLPSEKPDPTTPTTDVIPEINSVAFVRRMLDIVVRVAWECSNGDEAVIKRATMSVLQTMHPDVPADLIVSGLGDKPSAQPADIAEEDQQDVASKTKTPFESNSSETSEFKPKIFTEASVNPQMTFEEFRATPECLPLQEAYESSKIAIKHNKARQIEFVNIVNGWKQKIDTSSEITKRYKRQQKANEATVAQDGDTQETPVTLQEFEAAAAELEAAKLGYRQAHAELQALRQEADALAAQKRQALEDIASAYQIYISC